MDPFKWCNRWTFACNIPPTGIFFWTNSRAAWYFFFFFSFFPPSHNITLSPKLLMGLGDKDDWSVVRRKEWLVTIRGLPCRLSISDCFSIIIYDKWLLHTMTFRSSPICHLMPSWFHLIGIALKHFFLPFSFRCSWFCIWFKFAAFPHSVFTRSASVWVQLLDPPSLKCLLNNVSLVKAHSGFLLALSPGLCY